MSNINTFDQEVHHIAVRMIRRNTFDADTWKSTVIGTLHPDIALLCQLLPEERVLASAFISSESWWLISTRRIIGQLGGALSQLDPRHGIQSDFGGFKGINRSMAPSAPPTEIATIASPKSQSPVRFEFESGKAAIAPIYACMFWSRTSRFHYRDNDA